MLLMSERMPGDDMEVDFGDEASVEHANEWKKKKRGREGVETWHKKKRTK